MAGSSVGVADAGPRSDAVGLRVDHSVVLDQRADGAGWEADVGGLPPIPDPGRVAHDAGHLSTAGVGGNHGLVPHLEEALVVHGPRPPPLYNRPVLRVNP